MDINLCSVLCCVFIVVILLHSLHAPTDGGSQDARHVAAVDWSQPPLECQLADYTIWPGELLLSACLLLPGPISAQCEWPTSHASHTVTQMRPFVPCAETKKVFGHSNDVMCLAVSADGRWLASACKARDSSTAAVHLWEADRWAWTCVQQLACLLAWPPIESGN